MAFCKNCGGLLREESNICPRCGTKRPVGINFCPTCGGRTSPYDTVCPQCQIPLNNIPPETSRQEGTKSKLTAGLLGIFLGTFGVHNFYLGYTAKAVIQLVISLITCCICAPVSSIWGLIEGILILCGNICVDGKGNPLGE